MEINTGETIGLKRKLDNLGRIVLPSEFRKELGVGDKDEVEIFLLENGLFMKTQKKKELEK